MGIHPPGPRVVPASKLQAEAAAKDTSRERIRIRIEGFWDKQPPLIRVADAFPTLPEDFKKEENVTAENCSKLCGLFQVAVTREPAHTVRMVGITVMYAILKIIAPWYSAREKQEAMPEVFSHRLIGAACWGVVVLRGGEDMVRQIFWHQTLWRLDRLKPPLYLKHQSYIHHIRLWVLVNIGALLELLALGFFSWCTWQVLKASETVQGKVSQCGALSIFFDCDEILLNYLLLDGRGEEPLLPRKPTDLFDEPETDLKDVLDRTHIFNVCLGTMIVLGMLLYIFFFD